jgi:hypothetical protein
LNELQAKIVSLREMQVLPRPRNVDADADTLTRQHLR